MRCKYGYTIHDSMTELTQRVIIHDLHQCQIFQVIRRIKFYNIDLTFVVGCEVRGLKKSMGVLSSTDLEETDVTQKSHLV